MKGNLRITPQHVGLEGATSKLMSAGREGSTPLCRAEVNRRYVSQRHSYSLSLVRRSCWLSSLTRRLNTFMSFRSSPTGERHGWQFSLLVTNVSQSASQCAFSLYGMDVDRFADISGITAAGSTATFDLEGPGDYLVWGTKNELSVASGSATLDCSASVVAQVLYALLDQFGETAGMATVFSSQAAAVFQFPVLEQGTLALVARCRRAAQRARRTIQGCEAMHMIRKGQARGVSSSDVWRQIQFINKLFEVAA